MPRYDYRCRFCDNVKEEIHRMDETPEVICGGLLQEAQISVPGSTDTFCTQVMEKAISPNEAGSFILKGNGYYSIDSRKITTPSDIVGNGEHKYGPNGELI